MDKRDIIEGVKNIIQRHLAGGGFDVFLFGSQARRDHYLTSDIDIGILGKSIVPKEAMFKILEEKEEIPTLRGIDIVDLQLTDAPFREDVLSYAKRI